MAIAEREIPAQVGGDVEVLERTWRSPRGLVGWFSEVNHKEIGKRYVVTAMAVFLLAGLEALAMRLQLAVPENDLLGQEAYRQFFTMHGTSMMFLFAVPVMEGVAIYLVPLMIGAREMALPRLNAFGYYVYLLAVLTLYGAFLAGHAPNSGWFNYVPLARQEYEPGYGIDYWATMIAFVEVAALVAAVGLIVTILKVRAPGMSLNRMPIYVWSVLVMSGMIVFAMPPLTASSLMLAIDRLAGGQFFNPEKLGDPLLWQHLFWYFGHPEVYIIFIPGLGFVSMIIATFSRRPIFGYTPVVLAMVSTGILSFGLWVHHMYATGLPRLGTSFFTAASTMVTIPTAVQFFCWAATFWGGRPVFRTPLLFALGFLVIFLIGGITGVQLGSVPFDLQVHDTFFVVAHFHYVLLGGTVFPLFAAIYYWFPKVTGRMLGERLGRINFALMFVGVHLTFWPQHHLGFMGMPRRVHTYAAELGWGSLNLVSTIGAFTIALGVLAFLANLVVSLRWGAAAGADPWGGDTFEWATSSPPASYNFRYPPVALGRHPLWDPSAERPSVVGLRDEQRETLVTTLMDARPDHRAVVPGPSLLPFLAALAGWVGFVGVIYGQHWVPVSAVLTYLALVVWNWPSRDTPPRRERPDGPEHQLARREKEREKLEQEREEEAQRRGPAAVAGIRVEEERP